MLAALGSMLLLNVIAISCCGQDDDQPARSMKGYKLLSLPDTTLIEPPVDNARLFVTGEGVNVRSQASADSEIVGLVERWGSEFVCIGEETDTEGKTWYMIELDAKNVGWIAGDFSLKIDYGEENIQAYIEALAKYSGAVGVQAAYFEKGQVTSCFCCGYADKDTAKMTNSTKIRVASLSKILLAIEAVKLQELGIISIDENIGTYWDCSLPKKVTIRSLLTHSSTLLQLDYLKNVEDTREQLTLPQSYSDKKVGSAGAWQYSNFGAGIAGTTLELAFSTPLEAFGSYQLFQGMNIDASWYSGNYSPAELASLYYPDGTTARSAEAASQMSVKTEAGQSTEYFAGSLTISACDFAKLMAMLANDGIYDGNRYLSEESVEIIEERYYTVSESSWSFEQCMPLRYKDGLYGEDALYYHTGNAYGVLALASYNPKTACGVVVVTTGAPVERDEQGIYLMCSEITEFIYRSQRAGD